jgi:WD40 repeat protein
LRHEDGVEGLAFSPDGKLLISAGTDRTMVLWDLTTMKELARLKGHEENVYGVAFNPTNPYLIASVSRDRSLRLWDINMATWPKKACEIVSRNLSCSEWDKFVGKEIKYQ